MISGKCAAAAAIWLAVTPATLSHAQFGVPLSDPTMVNTNAGSDTTTQDAIPDLATNGQGVWIAVWQLTGAPGWPNGGDPDIYFSRSINNGVNWSPPAPLNHTAATDSADDLAPRVFTDGAGHWLCAWYSTYPINGAGVDRDIVISRSTDNGLTWSPFVALNANATVDFFADMDIELAWDGVGTWIAAWRTLDTLNGSIGPDADLLFSRSTDHGASWSPVALLNTNAGGDHGDDLRPKLATDRSGNWIAVWQSTESFTPQPSDYEILYSRSSDNGVSWSPPAFLNSNFATTNRPDVDPRIVTDRQGTWIVVWSSTDNIASNETEGDILFSRSINNGAAWSPATLLVSHFANDSGADVTPALSYDGAGRWIAVWTSSDTLQNTLGTDNDILVAHSLNNGGSWSSPAAMNTNAGSDAGTDEFPQIVADGMGGYMTVWESRDSLNNTIGTDRDVLFARFALPDCNFNTLPDVFEADCNRNGAPDSCDIAGGSSADRNRNGIPDECDEPPNPCPADCDQPPNGVVDIDDLVTLITNWNSTIPGNPADVNGSGIVNIDDLVLVIVNWGPCG